MCAKPKNQLTTRLRVGLTDVIQLLGMRDVVLLGLTVLPVPTWLTTAYV